MKGIYIVLPIWGERFVARWLKFSLPSLLAPGNLPALAKNHTLKLLLCSTHQDLRQILSSPLIKAARDVMGIRTLPIAQEPSELASVHKYEIMNACHNHGIALAWQDDFGLIFGIADALYADGSFAEIARQIAAGKRAALTQGINVIEDQVEGLLAEHRIAFGGTSLTVPPRTLVNITSRALHPVSHSLIWGSENFTLHPSILYWPLGGHGFLMRSWHLFPMFAYPDRKATIAATVDGDFIDQALSNPEDDCGYLDDSDNFFVVGVDSEKEDFLPGAPSRANPASIALWLPKNTRPFNRRMIEHKFWFHDGIDRAQWRHVEAESDQAIALTLACYEHLLQLQAKPQR